jgi:hypothetical protein
LLFDEAQIKDKDDHKNMKEFCINMLARQKSCKGAVESEQFEDMTKNECKEEENDNMKDFYKNVRKVSGRKSRRAGKEEIIGSGANYNKEENEKSETKECAERNDQETAPNNEVKAVKTIIKEQQSLNLGNGMKTVNPELKRNRNSFLRLGLWDDKDKDEMGNLREKEVEKSFAENEREQLQKSKEKTRQRMTLRKSFIYLKKKFCVCN